MYANAENIFNEYLEKCTIESKLGKMYNIIFDNIYYIFLTSNVIIFLIVLNLATELYDILIWGTVFSISIILLESFFLIRVLKKKLKIEKYRDVFKFNPDVEWRKDLNSEFDKLMKKHNLNYNDEMIQVMIKYCKEKAEKTRKTEFKTLAILGGLCFPIWSKIVGLEGFNSVEGIAILCFCAVLIFVICVVINIMILDAIKDSINLNSDKYKQFAQKLESYYYSNKFKNQPKTPDFTPFPTHPFKWRYTATKGLELKLKNKAKESLTISFNETELNILFAHILKKQPVDLANEKRKLENEEYTEGIGYFIKDILNKEESIKVTKYLVALLESKRIIETNGNHNKIKISLDTQVFNWQTIF